jgi:hypothetical protein
MGAARGELRHRFVFISKLRLHFGNSPTLNEKLGIGGVKDC